MKILIASTNLHLINSIIISKQFKDDYQLFFIGKKSDFLEFSKKFFRDVILFEEDKSSLFKKVSKRVENSKKMIELAEKLKPDEIIVGNDRKIETSVLIENFDANYSYMDDGLHSYIPEKQHLFKYSIFEKWLKELLYRSRLQVPKFIGCNLKKAYLYKPEFAFCPFKEKVKLDINLLRREDFEDFLDVKIDFNKLILFPHPKFVNSDFLEKVKKIADEKTAVKLHPRDKNSYPFKVLDNIPFEILLLKMDKNVKIYGDKTTALLIASWLGFESYTFSENQFFAKNGVKLWS